MFDSFCDSNSIQFCSEVAEWQRDLAALTPDAPRAESLTADPKQLADPALANPEARDATAVLDALAEQVFDSVQFKFYSILRASNRRADVRPTGAAARVRTEWELNRIAQARLLELGAHPALRLADPTPDAEQRALSARLLREVCCVRRDLKISDLT